MVKPSFTEVPMSPECPTGQSGHKKSTVATINTLCRLYNSHLLGIFLSWHIYTWEMLILKANNMNRDHAVVLDRQREFKGTMHRMTVSQQIIVKRYKCNVKKKYRQFDFTFWTKFFFGHPYQVAGLINRLQAAYGYQYHFRSENKSPCMRDSKKEYLFRLFHLALISKACYC